MGKVFVRDLTEGAKVDTVFALRGKFLGTDRRGKPYLSLRLGDRTGEVDGRVWEDAGQVDAAAGVPGDYIRVRGDVSSFNGNLQVHVKQVSRVPAEQVQAADYLPVSKRDPEEMERELRTVIAGLGDPFVRRLCESIVNDEPVLKRLKRCPAGKTVHHAYVGGLLEHKLSCIRVAELLCAHYGPVVNRDVVIAGLLFHDLGKIYELDWERSFEYTEEGQLVGHLAIGFEMITERALAIPEFPPRLLRVLRHCVLSHHGKIEFGSPKLPVTLESFLVAAVDDLDGRFNQYAGILEGLPERETWSAFQKTGDRMLFDWRKADRLDEAWAGDGARGESAQGAHRESKTQRRAAADRGEGQKRVESGKGDGATPLTIAFGEKLKKIAALHQSWKGEGDAVPSTERVPGEPAGGEG